MRKSTYFYFSSSPATLTHEIYLKTATVKKQQQKTTTTTTTTNKQTKQKTI